MYNHIKRIIIGITIGIIVGSIIGALGFYGVIPREFRDSTTYATVKMCIGLIVLIVDLLCVWGRIKPIIDKHIDKNGKSATGTIESVRVISHPKHYIFNDEESNRNGIGIWSNEQAAREIYLAPFEYAIGKN